MNRTRHYITILLTMLLLLSGVANEAWAAKVRYHILTLPFSIRNYDNSGFYKENIRVEALLVISDAPDIGLPEQYKSPLAKNFRYWKNWPSEYTYLFHREKNNHVLEVKYYIYNETTDASNEITEGDAVSSYTDIYVTYEYDEDGEAADREIFLDKSQDYNITVGGDKFLCYNRSRNNRIANANTGSLTGEDLVSYEFVVPEAGTGKNQLGFNWSTDQYAGAHGVHMGFWLAPTPYEYDPEPDPYNITIMTAYVGDETYQKDPVENKYFVKPYKGATLFSILKSNSNGGGTDTKMWFDCDNDLHYKGVPDSPGINDPENSNYWEKQVDYWPGYFRNSNQPLFNSVALLNHPSGNGYVFVGSKFNQGVGNGAYKEWAPNSSGNYATLTSDNLNPYMCFKTLDSSPVINIYKIRKYILKIKTHGSKTELDDVKMRWSDARASDKIVDHLPEAFKRKYCSYKAYVDEGLTKEVTTFADVKSKIDSKEISEDEYGNIVLWFDYTVTESIPFETLPIDGSYTDAHWYTMRMNGKAETKNIAYKKADGNDNFITDPTKGDNTNLHQGENFAEAMVAFIGDPYELKIISRAASEAASANRYVGCATGAVNDTGLTTDKTGTSDITTWEIAYESTDMDNFILRQYGTYASSGNPKYVGWNSSAASKPVVFSTDSTRIRVIDLDKVSYTYYVMDLAGNIAVKATANEYVGKPLTSWMDIPEIIRSSSLATATVNFYDTKDRATANNATYKITNVPYNYSANNEIYIRYSYGSSRVGETYNVILNNEYIYTTDAEAIQSQTSITTEQAVRNPYQWFLDYRDPYAMTIKNQAKNNFINVSSWADKAILNWVDEGSASKFIVKSSGQPNTYEVMAATGEYIDASTTYYNIGRPLANTVKLYSNSSYLHGNATLRFQLIGTDAHPVTYKLVDKNNIVLLQSETRQTTSDKIAFPPEYHSPLVEKYYYYPTLADAIANTNKIDVNETLVGSATEFYVTYDVNDLVNLKAGQLYLLEYEAGEYFRQEDGSNGLLADPSSFDGTEQDKEDRYKAVYPYCNGDGNFFVYGKEQYELQQEGAASTRTRWAWYVESTVSDAPKGDPYHVTIKSRQLESYPITNSSDYNGYFMTYQPEGYPEVVTSLGWPGMSSETATEYMVLGSEGQYQLVTTYTIPVDANADGDTDDDGENARYVVDSFEQYWKTYDTVKNILLKDKLSGCAEEDKTDRTDGSITVPLTPESLRETLTKKKSEGGEYEFHSYNKWAYAKRWNGYNNGYSSTVGTPETKKGWETIEHWYQTIDMGQGYFNFVKTSIDPVLILLDQHGWEIMRKPLPNSPDDPEKDAKYDAIRPYNSPMVKEYAFWSSASKRSGLHQYYKLKNRIGDDFTSTDLTKLPPYGSKNVLDSKGNLNDQYVTYIVKDEYAQTYNPSDKTAKPFLIEQGSKYVSTTDGLTLSINDLPSGGLQQRIINDEVTEAEKWYVKPNPDIDTEMGYGTVPHAWNSDNPNAYETDKYKNEKVAEYIDDSNLGEFSFSNGFDPYNIQITPMVLGSGSNFIKTNATGATLDEGVMHGTYDSFAVELGSLASVEATWFDNVRLAMTNATFMAVQDANGNMQLMPRFDHDRRMSEFGTLIEPTAAEVASTYTKLYRPEVYEYLIIDNSGHESLRYKSGGDLLPQTPDHFKSPLAKEFEYYASATESDATYSNLGGKIDGALDGAKLDDNKVVYVRYKYDEDADGLNMLKGNWLTMQIDNKTTQYNTGIYSSSIGSYSLTATNYDDMINQAKQLTATGNYYFKVGSDTYYQVNVITPSTGEVYATYTSTSGDFSSAWSSAIGTRKQVASDDDDKNNKAKKLTETGDYYFKIGTKEPYTYEKINVSVGYISGTAVFTSDGPLVGYSSDWENSKPMIVNADGKKWQWKFLETPLSEPDPYAVYIYNRSQSSGTEARPERFALLSHSDGDYALAEAGLGNYTYNFLNGSSMNTTTAATIAKEDGFTSSAGTFSGTGSQVKLTDEVQHDFIYKVYTNSGVFAIDANQTQTVVVSYNWEPILPEAARTPLLNIDQYRYYEHTLEGTVSKNDTLGKSLSTLFGLYDDIVYTHYTPYDGKVTNYLVPNDKTVTEGHVARGSNSNDAPLGLNGKRQYNIIWYNDEMMKADGETITSMSSQSLQSSTPFEWEFEGDDPYAIKIKSVDASKYVHEDSPTNNLNEDATTFMLLNRDGYQYGVLAKTGDASTMLSGHGNALTTSDPTKFIIFALSTYKVIYHLIIANIGETVSIPYAELDENEKRVAKADKVIHGSTLRDLTTREITEGVHVDGDKYQLGESLSAIKASVEAEKKETISTGLLTRPYIYCKNAGHVSLGDGLKVPEEFYRPNVHYDFYIEGVYSDDGTSEIGALNNKYKGLKMDYMPDDSELLEKMVFVNIVYSFLGGLDTNSGSDFVNSVDLNKWYTYETNNATPRLAEYTGSSLKTQSGYATHHTNDYLWTPVGDPYGFKMYNRYSYKNLGRANEIMTTSDISAGREVTMVVENPSIPNDNAVYELLATNTTTAGYFLVHPVVNNTGLQYYMTSNSSTGAMTLTRTPTEWTFGLSEEVMQPYSLAAGYVGGLNATGQAAYKAATDETDPLKRLMDIQEVVYNHDKAEGDPENYIVHYAPGYYRLHNQPGSSGISTPRYVSGYTHKIEKDVNNDGYESDAIPMHFYEVEVYGTRNPVFTDLGTAGTDYTNTPATRGDLPLITVINDPASIFRFTGDASSVTMSTQGLYVKENKMTATESSATLFSILDIGAGVVALQEKNGTNFLKYDQTARRYDVKFNNTAETVESARWCMKPVQKAAAKGNGEMELRVSTNTGGDGYYYTTFCAPFDVLMTNSKDEAYVVPMGEWPTITPPEHTDFLYPKRIGQYNTGTYAKNNQFIPAGTPVLIRTSNPLGYVTMVLPTTAPSASVSCVFTGKYLEQMLAQGEDDVYVFGRDLGTFTKAADYARSGLFAGIAPSLGTDVGFYVNANPNKEANEHRALWTRNNKYVLANKVYYRAPGGGGASARRKSQGATFIRVIFDEEGEKEEPIDERLRVRPADNRVYDLQGRCVATEEEVSSGHWRLKLNSGVYIFNGKKIVVK